MLTVIVRDNVVENIAVPGPKDGPPPAGTKAYPFDGFVAIGWLWNDGVPVDPNPPSPLPPAVPSQVSAAQMIRALDAKKIYDDVDTAIKNIGGLTSLLWARAPFFARSDPLMVDAAKALGMSDADLDDLFLLAAKM